MDEDVASYLAALPMPQEGQFKDRLTAAIVALGMARRCVERPGPETHSVGQLRAYLTRGLEQVQEALASLPPVEPPT